MLAALAACASIALVGALENAPVAQTSSGPVRGVWEKGRRVFRGIPYAAPPVGDLRFRPPSPHPRWTRFDAFDFGPSCPQYPTGCWNSSNVTKQSEDCLTVNVVTPGAPPPKGGFAVMVFIHAGEFRCGCSNDAESNWPSFGDEVVYVSFNYRIGALGFLADSSLRARDPAGSTGNYGLLDQRFLLQWVQQNIAAFGGNPDDVSIWGESSGGTSVAFHLLAAGRGLVQPFQKAILESPGLGQVREWKDATLNTEFVLAVLAASGSPNCHHTYGYVAFTDNVLFTYGTALLHTESNISVEVAKNWCNDHTNCTAFMHTALQTEFISGAASVFDIENYADPSHPTVYLKQGPERLDHRAKCLISADVGLLTNLTESLPLDDTFYTDGWAPVVDAITLPTSLEDQLTNTGVPAGVNVLLGSNLDEGTEFMMLAPHIACNASEADFRGWIDAFLGPDAVSDIVELYAPSTLTRPLPDCDVSSQQASGPKIPGEEAVYFNAAMRVAGDISVVCPTNRLATAVKAKAFNYHFSMTPAFSWNFEDTSTMGAFHGADVPFVFGTSAELNTTAEKQLSSKMVCMWSSFARTGDPSKDCQDIAWPAYNSNSEIMELGANVVNSKPQSAEAVRCKALEKYESKQRRSFTQPLESQIILA